MKARRILVAAAMASTLLGFDAGAAVTTFWSAGTGCSGPASANFSTGGAAVTMTLCATTTAPDGVCGATIVPVSTVAQSGHFNITNRVLNATVLPDPTTGASPVTYPVALTSAGAQIPPMNTLDWGGTVNVATPPSAAANQPLATFAFTPTGSAAQGSYVVGVNAASVLSTSGTDCLAAATDTPITATFTLSLVATELNFAQANYSVTEGGPAITVGVTRSGPLTSATSVTWTTANGTATAGADFGTGGSPTQRTGTLNWAAGDGATKNITVGAAVSNIPVINDTVVDPGETFTIVLSNPTNGISLGATSSTTITINDNDSAIRFTNAAVTVGEAGPNVTLQVERTGATTLSQAVTWRTANGSALAGQDFGTLGSTLQPSGTITFAPGDAGPKTITIGPTAAAAPFIPIINDTTVEGLETFTVVLSAPTNGATLGTSTATVTIASDEKAASMASPSISVPEGAGSGNVVVKRLGSSAGAASVAYGFVNGTGTNAALNGTHFGGTPGTVTWADGDAADKSIPFTVIENNEVNAARTFSVTLSSPSGIVIAPPTATTVSITDNDGAVQFSLPTASVTEGAASVALTVVRIGDTSGPATVDYSTVNGTAIAGSDFGTSGNSTAVTGTLSWAAGNATSQVINIPILNDTVPEGPKTFSVQLANATGASIGTNGSVAVTLNDNDAGVRFASATYEVTEGTANVVLTVQRTGPASAAASVTWSTVNGTAVSGQDFGIAGSAAPRTGTLSWTAGTSTPKTITIPILNDTVGGEGDETFTVVLTPGAGAVVAPPAIATVTIHDNDPTPQSRVRFDVPKVAVAENAGSVTLTLKRVDDGGGFGAVSTVTYATVPGSALATSDYTTKTGTVTWPAGDSSDKTVSIAIVNNTTAEPNETFRVVLSNPTSLTGLGSPSEVSVMILDDDEVFPANRAIPAGWTKPDAAAASWHVFNDPTPSEGAFVLRTDPIADNEAAEIEATGTFAAGSITFKLRTSSEPGFDVLTFSIDGNVVGTWSGTAPTTWQAATFPIAAGVHTVRWSYQKDGSLSAGQDAMFLDAVVLPGFTP